MKYTIGILASLGMVAISQAVSVTTTLPAAGADIVGGSQRGLFDNAGNALLGTYLGYGTFDTLPDFANSTGQQVADAFTLFGSSGLVSGTPVGATSAPGTYAFGTNQGVPGGDPIADDDIFVVFGNQATLEASTELLVVNTGLQFGDDDPTPGIVNYDLRTFTGDPTYGSSAFAGGTFTINGTDFAAAPNSFQLAPLVPEPSSSLLFGFAGLALLIRRKR